MSATSCIEEEMLLLEERYITLMEEYKNLP